MSTKPPSKVQLFEDGTIEGIAYGAAAEVPTREPNDRARLGYCVWAWLTERNGTLDAAIRAAGVRTNLPESEVRAIVRRHLEAKGMTLG
ncbi:MAG: hypothetical protein AABY75_02535 [Bacteroidota bacterium]